MGAAQVQAGRRSAVRSRDGAAFSPWYALLALAPRQAAQAMHHGSVAARRAAVAPDARDAVIGTGGSPPERPARRPPSPRSPARSRRVRGLATAAPWKRRSRRTDR